MQQECFRGLESIPQEMRALDNWLVWKLEERHGKPAKVPYSAHGGPGKTNDPATWDSYDNAIKALRTGRYNGIGFVLEGTPFVGVDLDHVIDAATGKMRPEAARIVAELDSYTEYSQSGTGLHIIARGKRPGNGKRCKSRKGSPIDAEIYGDTSPRYFIVTGKTVDAKPIREAQSALEAIFARFFAAPEKKPDDKLLQKIKSSKSAAQFSRLWAGDTSDYGGDESRADMALCNMLAFWTGKDHKRMDELFRQSGLYRPKWDERRGDHTYGDLTIQEAVDKCSDVYKGKPRADAAAAEGDTEYYIEDGCWHCAPPGKVPFRMCNFTAEVKRELVRDDGLERRREFIIAGKHAAGDTLPELTVAAQQFPRCILSLTDGARGPSSSRGRA